MLTNREFDQHIADDWTDRRIKALERALREIDAEVEEHIDINAAGGPNLAMRISNIVAETGVRK